MKRDKIVKFIKKFLKLEAASGIVLMAMTLIALLIANSPLGQGYQSLCRAVSLPVNDGLMVIFFLLIGLELRRETRDGELSTVPQALLPALAALGGVVTPAIIYSVLNWGSPAMRGWAIPSATDIAFSLGVLALFGHRVKPSLKIFLMAVAVMDDLAAVVIIALFYTDHLSMPALAAALVLIGALFAFNRFRVGRLWPYLAAGLALWAATFASGVHPTIAGVALGLLMPPALGKHLEDKLLLWVEFGIVPIFVLANAGVPLLDISPGALLQPVTLGILLGLFIGKQTGIALTTWLLVRLKFARLPEGANWKEFYAVCMIAGIGFTMSLFIGGLAFSDESLHISTRLGVIIGSIFSAVCGSILMYTVTRRQPRLP